MKKIIISLVLGSLVGCATGDAAKSAAWKNIGYSGFAEKINRIAGDEAIDCGFYDSVNPKIKPPKKVSECIQGAVDKGLAFKYGTKRIPTDSLLYEVVLKDREGSYWNIVLDIMLDQSDITHDIKKCRNMKFDYEPLTYEGSSCEEVTAQEWLSDIK